MTSVSCKSHNYKIERNDKWIEFLQLVKINSHGQHVLILYQYLVQQVLNLLLKDRNTTDKPELKCDIDKPITNQ